jgi:hypothetical protein
MIQVVLEYLETVKANISVQFAVSSEGEWRWFWGNWPMSISGSWTSAINLRPISRYVVTAIIV